MYVIFMLCDIEPFVIFRILVLGLGGGSAARILRALAPDAEIVGAEPTLYRVLCYGMLY